MSKVQAIETHRQQIIESEMKSYLGKTDIQIAALSGDASTRDYYRISGEFGSLILMDVHTPFRAAEYDFLLLQTYLKASKIPVPDIPWFSEKTGLILLEDLGDLTLQEAYRAKPSYTLERYYPRVFELLVKVQQQCISDTWPACPAFKRQFDSEKFQWELEFFLQHFIRGYLGVQPDSRELKLLRRGFVYISNQLAVEPTIFTHRDFQARNIMIHRDKLFLLDFQDARLGLQEYDLASYLRDAYVELPDSQIENTLALYYSEMISSDVSWEKFRQTFSLMCIQRNLKALGTFGFQASVRKNTVYIEYIPVMTNHLGRELFRHPKPVLKDFTCILVNLMPGITS